MTKKKKIRIALALGGGGAKGLAHIPILEAFEELDLKPHRLAGTSIGAIVATLYGAGLSAAELRAGVSDLVVTRRDRLADILRKRDVFRWLEFLDPTLKRGGLLKGESFQEYLAERMAVRTFADLAIPVKVVAADFWSREQVVLDSGNLSDAVKASMAIPGLFSPVELNGRVLIDGGVVNPVPYDLLQDDCDITVAVDVSGSRSAGPSRLPNVFDALFNSIQIMQRSILEEKLKRTPPDILVRPDVVDIRILDFFEADRIYAQAEPAKQALKDKLVELTEA
jgi:NTE family protein